MKKMRRLIPAIAMLLVSAVMLSTASFAWFTMNSKVEATGMTVQAKSTGAMIIGTKPLTAASTDWEAKFASLGNTKLAPVSYGSYKIASLADDGKTVVDASEPTTGWFDAYNSALVDSMTGESKHFKTATIANGSNYIDYVVFVGLASESEIKNIKATLTTDLSLYIAGAYAVAFYVDQDASNGVDAITAQTAPALLLHCTKTANLGVTNTGLLFNAPVAIPSTVGVEATEDETKGVGIAITMRVFIDGNLKDGKTITPKEPKYEAATGAFDPAKTYFTLDASTNTYVLAPLSPDDYLKEVGADGKNVYNDIGTGYYVVNGTQDGATKETYFVSTANAPQAPSQLNVSFELVDESRTAD